MEDLYYLSAYELHDLISRKKISAEELCRSVLARIEAVENKVKAYVTLAGEQAVDRARAVDKKIAAGEQISPLAGIPVAVKDNICTRGMRTTCSSKILYNFVPPYNATVIDKMNDNDMILIGKTNMDEFAMGSSTENSGFFITANPWDLERVPGGSSGGSAAAVAAGEATVAVGSDTGGSIRQPASFCGVVGMKPTYGAVSRYGLVAFASSLDQIGPFSRCVADCALMMNVLYGHDPFDSTSLPVSVPDYSSFLYQDVKGVKIGVPREYMGEGISDNVRGIVRKAVELFRSLGAVVEETSLPHTKYALPTYYLIAPAEASSNLARYDGVRYGLRVQNAEDVVDMFMKTRSEGFGDEVKRRIMLGTYALSTGYYDAYYLKALKVRTLIKEDFDRAFEKYDLLLSPTAPSPAFRRGEKIDSPLEMYMSDICTLSVNLAGIPAISIPAGFSDQLPVGLQLMGKPLDEGTIIRAAHAFENNTGYYRHRPQI